MQCLRAMTPGERLVEKRLRTSSSRFEIEVVLLKHADYKYLAK